MHLRHTDNLSKTLQSPSLSAADSQQLAQLTCNTLERLRNQECFSLLWSKVSGMQEKLQIDEPMLPRKRKAPRRYEVGDGQGTFLETVQDYFRAEYYVVIDAALISRNGPYIRGHPVVFFHIEFQTCLIYSKNRFDYNMHFSWKKH